MTVPAPALLVLADGATFEGEAVGAEPPGGVATGEVVFNTAMTGYQEVLTDPSYAGQIVAFTYPHVGNYGVSAADHEAAKAACRGVVVRDLARRPSSWRADGNLDAWLRRTGMAGIAGIDTRRLTRHIRSAGAMPAAMGTADRATLLAAAQAEPGTDGVDLVRTVTCRTARTIPGTGPRRIVAVDYGVKGAMLRQLATLGTVELVPASATAEAILALRPDGVFLSNGPGDPSAVDGAPATIRAIVGRVPVFGICLGHQLLATALGGATQKLRFGHHGANHPVRRLVDGRVEITSQNHGFAVVDGSVDAAEVTHVNLNDGVLEGLRCRDVPAFSVQYHPEAAPGPHDARSLFADFAELMDRHAP